MNKLKMMEYASMWGCEPAYDQFPNEKGDGCLFYNFSNVANLEPAKKVAFYENFMPAIERTIKGVELKPEMYDVNDVFELKEFFGFVKTLYILEHLGIIESNIPDNELFWLNTNS